MRISPSTRVRVEGEILLVRTPRVTPMVNTCTESFFGTLKHKCLKHFVSFAPQQLAS